MSRCWETKYLLELPVRYLVTSSMTPTMTNVRQVRGTLSTSMEQRTLTMVMALLSSWGILWPIIWRRVSISLVYMDMMSPWAWLSKYLMGSVCIWVNISSRRFFSVPWETMAIIRL